MTDVYCGCKDLPKGKRVGSMGECKDKNQIRLYGVNKVDKKTLERQPVKKEQSELTKLKRRQTYLKGVIAKNSFGYKNTEDTKAKEQYYKKLKEAEKEFDEIVKKKNNL